MPDAQCWEASLSSSAEGLRAALHWQPPCWLVAPRLSCPSAPTRKGGECGSLSPMWRQAKGHLPTCHKQQLLGCWPSCCWKSNPTSCSPQTLIPPDTLPMTYEGPQTLHRWGISNSLSPVSCCLLPGLWGLSHHTDSAELPQFFGLWTSSWRRSVPPRHGQQKQFHHVMEMTLSPGVFLQATRAARGFQFVSHSI